ncbi:MAG: hypothetical protein KDD33_09835, partial [Bdellovibrionales bacterium]|nr:hypothetical protein [Bdellovibrionales bacterium]
NAPTIQYQQYLMENPNLKSYVQHLETQSNSKENSLRHHLKMAQFEFLDGSLEKAAKHFETTVDMKWEKNWNHDQRAVIHFAHLRLAQLQKRQKSQDHWLLLALQFSSKIKPDSNLFPPPLLDRYNQLKSRVTSQLWPLPEGSAEFDKIIVNGEELPMGSTFFQSSKGMVHVQFLSNRFQSITIVEDAKNIVNQTLAKIPLLSGNCLRPIFQVDKHLNNVKGFLDKECTVRPLNAQHPLAATIEPSSPQTTSKKAFQSRWVWWGLAIASAVVTWQVIENQNQSGPPPQPAPTPTKNQISNASASF